LTRVGLEIAIEMGQVVLLGGIGHKCTYVLEIALSYINNYVKILA